MNNKLDGLVQQWACTQRSVISGKPAECGHHIKRKKNSEILRYDLRNILPLTVKEHNKVHTGEIDDWSLISVGTAKYLCEQNRISLKQHLVERGITKKDWEKEQEKKLKEVLNEER